MENKDFLEEMLAQYNELNSIVKRIYYASDRGYATHRLVFLKYAVDNCLGAYTREEMQSYFEVQRLLGARDIARGPDALIPVLSILDNHYNTSGLFTDTLGDYAKDLFGMDSSWRKKSDSNKEFEKIMEVLSKMDLRDDPLTFRKGKMIEMILSSAFSSMFDEYGYRMAQAYTKPNAAWLAANILDVQDGEVFLDFVSGLGVSTRYIVEGATCRILNADINREVLSISAMMHILRGYSSSDKFASFALVNQNALSLSCRNEESGEYLFTNTADKIFVDAPLGISASESNQPYKESVLSALHNAALSLKDEGTAVIAVPAGTLFSTTKGAKELRESLMERNLIQCVISLPITYNGSSVTMNFVILSKKKNESVLFINCCSDAFPKKGTTVETARKEKSLTREGIDLIVRIISNREEVEYLSKNVAYAEIAKNGYDLSPVKYAFMPVLGDGEPVSEIDARLNLLYKDLVEMLGGKI